MLAGAALAGLAAGDAAAEARAGFDSAAGTFALSVDTGAGPDGNHAYELFKYYGGPGSGISARELSGYDNDGLGAASTCTREVRVGVWVRCPGSARQASLVFGDGTDVLALGPPDLWSGEGNICDIGNKSSDELPALRVEVRFGAGDDRLLRVNGLESACDVPSWGFGYLDHTWAVRAFGQAGNDTLAGGEINDLLDGGDGNDVLVGNDGGDTLQGGAGNDRANGVAGADTVRGGSGDDRLEGGEGADAMLGEDGIDMMLGGGGADLLDGGTGNDDVDGGSGDDTLRGGTGNDDLIGGPGSDSIDGGDGLLDEVGYETATSRVVVTLADTAANDGIVVGGVSERDSLRAVGERHRWPNGRPAHGLAHAQHPARPWWRRHPARSRRVRSPLRRRQPRPSLRRRRQRRPPRRGGCRSAQRRRRRRDPTRRSSSSTTGSRMRQARHVRRRHRAQPHLAPPATSRSTPSTTARSAPTRCRPTSLTACPPVARPSTVTPSATGRLGLPPAPVLRRRHEARRRHARLPGRRACAAARGAPR